MKKVALLFISLNPMYWPFLKDIVEDSRKHFLAGHQTDFFVWSDMPELNALKYEEVLKAHNTKDEINGMLKANFFAACEANPTFNLFECMQQWSEKSPELIDQINKMIPREKVQESVEYLRSQKDLKVFETDSVEWPYPTLMRYHLFLQQEEALKDYDYIFYLDADMRIVDTVGDEILGKGLMMAEHPMYSLRREYVPPFEPNNQSAAYVPRLGCVITPEEGVPFFKPLYAAGGFQGGTSESFIKAMKAMRDTIDQDLRNNYIAIWNDETHWNKYLFDYKGPINILNPSYVYPDSLIAEYYEKLWGQSYKPKIITLTKKFSTTRQAGSEIQNKLASM